MYIFYFLIMRVSFCAVGDILLDRGIRKMIEKNGVNYPFEKVSNFINKYDLAFCNLECSISSKGKSLGKLYSFRADTYFFNGVRDAGFNIISIANNHTMDYGREAFLETKEIIEKNGLYAIGMKNQIPTLIKKKWYNICFLCIFR